MMKAKNDMKPNWNDRTKVKKRIDWFNELEEPYRKQAIANTDPKKLNDMLNSMPDALLTAFIFNDSFQGLDYWDKLCEKYENNEK